jgi:hypothetical protein
MGQLASFGADLTPFSLKPRLVAMAVLSSCWGGRLTYNFWIKGGFSGGADRARSYCRFVPPLIRFTPDSLIY